MRALIFIFYLYAIDCRDRSDDSQAQSGRVLPMRLLLETVEQGRFIQAGTFATVRDGQCPGGYCEDDRSVLFVMYKRILQ